ARPRTLSRARVRRLSADPGQGPDARPGRRRSGGHSECARGGARRAVARAARGARTRGAALAERERRTCAERVADVTSTSSASIRAAANQPDLRRAVTEANCGAAAERREVIALREELRGRSAPSAACPHAGP